MRPFDRDVFARAARHACCYVRSGAIPSAVIAVANSAELLAIEGYDGNAEESADVREAIFALASISKAITGVGIARLVDQGILRYEDPVANYIPEFGLDDARRRITIGHILTHSTALPNLGLAAYCRENLRPEELYKLAFEGALLFDPGAGMCYASHTFQLLNEIVQRVLGMRMSAFLKEHVFDPCGMTDTSFRPRDAARMMPIVDHPISDPEKIERLRQAELSGSGIWSTARDLVKLGQALLQRGRLMSEETFRLMVKSHRSVKWNTGAPTCRTFGWVKEKQPAFPNQPEHGIYHGGATGTLLWIDRQREFVYVFLTNRWTSSNVQAFATLDWFYRP